MNLAADVNRSIYVKLKYGNNLKFLELDLVFSPSAKRQNPNLTLRQEARERGIISNVKPFIGTLRVTNPVRQSRASSRKRVLRGGGRPSLRSVDSEIKRCVIEPRNFLVVSPRLGQTRGPSQALAALGPISVPGHTGVGGTWRMIRRVPRELGRPCRLHRNAGRRPGLPTPG